MQSLRKSALSAAPTSDDNPQPTSTVPPPISASPQAVPRQAPAITPLEVSQPEARAPEALKKKSLAELLANKRTVASPVASNPSIEQRNAQTGPSPSTAPVRRNTAGETSAVEQNSKPVLGGTAAMRSSNNPPSTAAPDPAKGLTAANATPVDKPSSAPGSKGLTAANATPADKPSSAPGSKGLTAANATSADKPTSTTSVGAKGLTAASVPAASKPNSTVPGSGEDDGRAPPVAVNDIQAQLPAAPLSFAPRYTVVDDTKESVAGVAGAVRRRLLEEMLKAVDGPYKIMICDKKGADILSASFRMHELMELDVIVVEDLLLERQPIISSPALYFIDPDDSVSVGNMIADWSTRPKYRVPYVFWTSKVSPVTLRRIAAEKTFAKRIAAMKSLMVDFYASETLMFHLDTKVNLAACLFTVDPRVAVIPVATKLAEVAHTLSGGLAHIRYSKASRVSELLAQQLQRELKTFKSTPSITASEPPLFVIIDRFADLFEALVHHRTYQCLSGDLQLLPVDGSYEQTYQSRKGTETRVVQIDEHDMYWCKYRHESFNKCLKFFEAELKDVVAANRSLSHGMQKGAGIALAGNAMRALPEFLDQQMRLSVHVDLSTKITQQFSKSKLQPVIDVELDILLKRRSVKEVLKDIKEIGGDLTIPTEVRVRLLTLCFACIQLKDFPTDARLQLVAACGVEDVMVPIMEGLKDAVTHLSPEVLKFKASKEKEKEKEKDSKGEHPESNQETANLASYVPYAFHVLSGIINDTLSKTDFPYVEEPTFSTKNTTTATSARRTLRAKPQNEPEPNRKLKVLDLGHEGEYCLRSTQKVVLFVVGGVTYGEVKVAYELAKDHGQEIIVGGCHLLKPDDLITDLRVLGSGTDPEPDPVPDAVSAEA